MCLVDEVVIDDYMVRPVLHILSPNKKNAIMCIIAYKKLLNMEKINLTKIKIVISCIENHKDLL